MFFFRGAYSSTVRAEDSLVTQCQRAGNSRWDTGKFGETFASRHGNAEPSQRYTAGRCRD